MTEESALLTAFREAVRAKIRRDLRDEAARAEALRRAVLPVLRREVETARTQGLCRRVWLFGSFAWGRPSDRSDLDLLVEGDEDEIAWRVSRACRREVHVIAFDRAPGTLRKRALAEGLSL